MPLDAILTVNPGSSSLKLSVLGAGDRSLAGASVEQAGGRLDEAALDGFLDGAPPPDAVGIRVVHGGVDLRAPTRVDDSLITRLDGLADLAPLHNPSAVAAMRALRSRLGAPLVACFDTGFHVTIPDAAATYAIPREWRERWGIRRLGFHGLSHAWASRRTAELLGRAPSALRLVSCHLGAGASLAAVRDGVSVDTTMGFTPMEGLVMATRSGSIDHGALLWLLRTKGVSAAEAARLVDTQSGLLALAESADMRAVLAAEAGGDADAHLGVEVYLHRLRSLIAAMAASLGRLDAIVFTGGVGEGAADIRERCCAGLSILGVPAALDGAAADEDRLVSPAGAAVGVAVVHAREDREIAREVRLTLGG